MTDCLIILQACLRKMMSALEESASGMRVAKVVMNWKVAIDLPRSFGSMPGNTAICEVGLKEINIFYSPKINCLFLINCNTGTLSEMRAKLRESAVWPVRAGCYLRAARHPNHSKTLEWVF